MVSSKHRVAPGAPFYGPAVVHQGKDIVQLKVLSDRSAPDIGSLPSRRRPEFSSYLFLLRISL
jgi:hypothetical protein